jgi:MFS transporter, FHS family, L-fucose permease
MPLIQGILLDATSPAISFIVPAACFAVVACFAVYDLKAAPTMVKEQAA